MRRKAVQIRSELNPIPQLKCYPAKLNQVLMNLIVNAIDASHEEGVVTVRTSAWNDSGVRSTS